MKKSGLQTDFIKFLGTGGARFVVTEQLRASGGVWLSLDGVNLWLDPGPGALVRALNSRPKLDPKSLDAVILSHRHIDHCNDVNIVIEAMTNGGFQKRGTVFVPLDCIGEDPVVFSYVRDYAQELQILQAGGRYRVRHIEFETPLRHQHPDETYGFNFFWKGHKISWVIDTLFFDELLQHYNGELLVLHCVRLKQRANHPVLHLHLDDVRGFLREVRPKMAVLTHFGRTMLSARPWELAESLSQEFGLPVRAASDGWTLNLRDVFPEEPTNPGET